MGELQKFIQIATFIFLGFCFGVLSVAEVTYAQFGKEAEWTDTKFPSYIQRLTHFGQRLEWSHDGKKILFISKTFGDAYEYNIETETIRPLTTNYYYHAGYTRALYLSNGDILLVGPKYFNPDDWQEARFKKSELWVLSKELDSPPVRLGEYIWEGPAVSRTQLKIAWSVHHGNYPNEKRYWQMWVADIDYSTGKPRIKNQKVVLDNKKEIVKGEKNHQLEAQNFRPGKENELIFQLTLANAGTEVVGLNLETDKLVNYSKSPETYDEPEGIYPDGQYTTVESNRHDIKNAIDIYKLKLDSTAANWERITFFNKNGNFKATNPVISDDGKFIAFQVADVNALAGKGGGIYLLDIEKYEEMKRANENGR